MAAFEAVSGMTFASEDVSPDLAAVGVTDRYVAEDDGARIVLMVLAEPRGDAESDELLATSAELSEFAVSGHSNRGRLFLAWGDDGTHPAITAANDLEVSPISLVLERVPFGTDIGE